MIRVFVVFRYLPQAMTAAAKTHPTSSRVTPKIHGLLCVVLTQRYLTRQQMVNRKPREPVMPR